jgi:flagellar protein FlaI
LPDEKEFQEAQARNPHLREYLATPGLEKPDFYVQLDRGLKKLDFPNVMYPVGDPIFIHVLRKKGENETQYIAVEPQMNPTETQMFNQISDDLIKIAHTMDTSDTTEDLSDILVKLMNQLVTVDGKKVDEGGGDQGGFFENLLSNFGGTKKIKVKTRVVSATNQNLDSMIAA